jgi:hypothetical protein
VTVNAATGGTASASATSAEAGTAITLTATPDAGYELTGWTVNEGGVTVSDNSFTMPEGNVSITPKFRGTTLRSVVVQWFIGGNDSPDDVWGTASVSSDGANATQGAGDQYYSSYTIQARAGDEVTIAATPTSGMNSSFRTWTLTGGSSVIDASSATNTFTMPDEDINAKADFVMGTYTVVLKTEENANITPYYGDTPITSVEQSFQVAYDTPIVITGGATSAQSSRRGSNQQDLDITYTYDAQSQQLTINLKPGAGENVTITLH